MYTHCFSPSLLPRVPEHPAFLSSPSHLGRCASPRSHRAWAVSSLSVWRRRLRTSSDPGLLWWCSGMPRRVGSCTEVSKPRGSCRSHACTVRPDSPTWPRRSPRTWRSSASLNRSARQVRKKKKKQNKNNTTTWWRLVLPSLLGAEFSPPSSHSRTDAIPAGDSANSFKLQSLYNCTVAQERTNQSGACCVTRLMSPGQTAAKLSHVRFLFFSFFSFFFFAGERIVKVQKPLTRFIRCRGVLTDSGVKRDSRLHYDTQIQ